MGENSKRYTAQYVHSFNIGAFLQGALAVLWYISGNIVFGFLSGLNLLCTIFAFPIILTWIASKEWSPLPVALGPHQ